MSDESPQVFPVPLAPRAVVMIRLMPDGQTHVNCQAGSKEDALIAVGQAVVALAQHTGQVHPVVQSSGIVLPN